MTNTRQKQLTGVDSATDHVLGAPGAEVVVLEYGDFASPACARAREVLDLLTKEFGGELSLVFRHFPEPGAHPQAEMAAEAAEIMGAQGHFWAYHDLVFSRQSELSESSLRADAGRLGADLVRFDAELRGHLHLPRVQQHMESGRQLGVQSTPAFFVNGVRVEVSLGNERLAEAVEDALRVVDAKADGRFAQRR